MNQKFNSAFNKIINSRREKSGIGTLGEKSLHLILKHYYEPDESRHEVKIESFFADILNENGITEIQTRSFNTLRKKLNCFLSLMPVTVVYPVAFTKWLVWIDNKTGETTKKRKSPKTGTPYEIFTELYKIKNLLNNKNLKFCIVLLDIEEYRNLDGWSNDKKKGSSRYERLPVDLKDEIRIENISDYIKLIPEDLPRQFASKDFKKSTGLSIHNSQISLNILNYLKVVKRMGKKGNAYLYEINIKSY